LRSLFTHQYSGGTSAHGILSETRLAIAMTARLEPDEFRRRVKNQLVIRGDQRIRRGVAAERIRAII